MLISLLMIGKSDNYVLGALLFRHVELGKLTLFKHQVTLMKHAFLALAVHLILQKESPTRQRLFYQQNQSTQGQRLGNVIIGSSPHG